MIMTMNPMLQIHQTKKKIKNKVRAKNVSKKSNMEKNNLLYRY